MEKYLEHRLFAKEKEFFVESDIKCKGVKSNLKKRGMDVSNRCSFCQQEEETTEHALMLCEWTNYVWFDSPGLDLTSDNLK